MTFIGRLWPGLFAFAMIVGFYALPSILPQLIMGSTLSDFSAQAGGYNRPLIAAGSVAEDSLGITRPSPDLLYAACPYNLSGGDVEVTAPVIPGGYWSLAFYDSRTSNYYTLTDASLQTDWANVQIVRAGRSATEEVPVSVEKGRIVVRSPSGKGLVLVRVTLGQKSDQQIAQLAAFDCRSMASLPAGNS